MQTLNVAFQNFAAPTNPILVRLNKVINPYDPRKGTRKDILEEIHDLIEPGAFRVTLRQELPEGEKTLTARFLLAIMSRPLR